MATQKRRSKRITILIVPEDDAEPISFRVRTGVVKLLYFVGFILVTHMVGGAIFYWKYVDLSKVKSDLIAVNTELQEDNKRVLALEDQFYALENQYSKVKNLLGVEPLAEPENANQIAKRELSTLSDRIVPVVSTDVSPEINSQGTRKSFLLAPTKSKIEDYAENLPTFLPVKGFLTLDFQKDAWFVSKTHPGVDIVARKGSVIRAAGAGAVIFANWTFDLGNLIIIDHGGGLLSYYGHTQRMLKPEKTYAKKGEPIALLGSSGKSSGPHLHFEIRKDGVPMDPKEYVLAFSENVFTN